MTYSLQLFVAALFAAGCTVWAAWFALAAEAEGDLPRFLADQFAPAAAGLPLPRALHVARLALLGLAGAAAATTIGWWQWSAPWAATRLALVVVAVWAVGDLIPRLLAAAAPEAAMLVRPSALRTLRALRPLLALVGWADRFGVLTSDRTRQRELGAGRRDMLLGVFSLADTTVAEVMTPRTDIVAIDAAAETHDVLEAFRRFGHSRLPVFEDDPDHVLGIIYVKDLLGRHVHDGGDRAEWRQLIRPTGFVPEAKTLDRQMRDFQRAHGHLAIVVDEFGGTAGLVTLEDILEQVVGEIRDERDTDEVAPIERDGADRYWVQGSVPLSELEAVLEHGFGHEDVDTVGGLALALFGRVPRPGEAIDVEGFRIVAEQVARRRVRRVHVQRIHPEIIDEDGQDLEQEL
ncbi:MAG: hemolysin family protein [Gemmatimonadales bacterium]